jgi:competence protein ComEC
MKFEYRKIEIWQEAPFLRLVLPLIGGILFQQYCPLLNLISAFLVFSALLIAMLLWQRLAVKKQFKVYVGQGILLYSMLFFFGVLTFQLSNNSIRSNFYGKFLLPQNQLAVLRLTTPLSSTTNGFKASAKVVQIDKKTSCGNAFVYFSKNASMYALKYGDLIVTNAKFSKIKNTGNPNCFDFETYCQLQNSPYSIYIKGSNFQRIAQQANWIQQLIYSSRDACVLWLKTYIPGPLEAGVCEALLIGYKDDLDKNLQLSYSRTGIVHILAISGMHLGLLFFLLDKLLFFLDASKRKRFVKAIILLAFLWFFSLMTGASGSVIRAAVMFSFIIIGKLLERNTSIYNLLAAAAFSILALQPATLFDVGFQLSYIAVIGIIILQQPINAWFYFKDKIRTAIWSMIAVSIAAQILAFPICLFYFHQFPNLFLPANLIAIPLSTIILYGELLVLICCPFPSLAHIVGQLVSYLTHFMNTAVQYIDHFSFAVSDAIPFSAWDTLLLYIGIVLLCISLLNQNKKILKYFFCILVLFVLVQQIENAMAIRKRLVVVYQLPKSSAIDFIANGQYHEWIDSSLLQEELFYNFHIQPTHTFLHLKEPSKLVHSVNRTNSVLRFYNSNFLIVNKQFNYKDKLAAAIPIDYLILQNNPSIAIRYLLQNQRPKVIIIDGSNSSFHIAKWKKECAQLKIVCWDTPSKGAWIWKI